jgi:hypothetical protein
MASPYFAAGNSRETEESIAAFCSIPTASRRSVRRISVQSYSYAVPQRVHLW